MCAYESYRSSRLAPGPTVTKLGQIPHPRAQALRLVTANFDGRLFESQKDMPFKAHSPCSHACVKDGHVRLPKIGQTFPKTAEGELLVRDVSAVATLPKHKS